MTTKLKPLALSIILATTSGYAHADFRITFDLFDWSLIENGSENETGNGGNGKVLSGPDEVFEDSSYTYTINDYDSSKNYSFQTSEGNLTQDGDTLTLNTPSQVNESNEITLISTVDGVEHNKYLTFSESTTETTEAPSFDDSIEDTVEPDNAYDYTITNYDSNNSYNVSSNVGNVSLNNDVLTLNTPSSVPSDNQIVITFDINNETFDQVVTIEEPYEPELTGPNEVEKGDDAVYTISNFDEQKSYSVSSDVGDAQIEGSDITYQAPTTTSQEEFTLEIVVDGEIFTQTYSLSEQYIAQINANNGDELETDSSYSYVIENYDPSVNYTSNASSGSVSLSEENIVLNTPDSVPAGGELDLTITADSNESTVTFNIVEPYKAQLDINNGDTVEADSVYTYNITNYDSSVVYDTFASHGSSSLSSDEITLNTPTSVPSSGEMDLTVMADGEETTVSLNVVEPYTAEISASDGEEIETNNSYTYTISNYDSSVNYSVSSSSGTASVSGDTITLNTPSSVPADGTLDLTVNADGRETTTTFNITEQYVASVNVNNGDAVEVNSTYNYEITNYDSSINYSANVSSGSVSLSNGNITLDTPSTMPSSEELDLTITADGVDSVTTLNVVDSYEPNLAATDDGLIEVNQDSTYVYTINNYDDTRDYSMQSSEGNLSQTSPDEFTLDTPSSDQIPSDEVLTLTLTSNGKEFVYNIDFIDDYEVSYYEVISASSEDDPDYSLEDFYEEEGNLRLNSTYEIEFGPYESHRNYTVSTDFGTTSLSENIITLETPIDESKDISQVEIIISW